MELAELAAPVTRKPGAVKRAAIASNIEDSREGVFKYIHKDLLHVDHSYQRERINRALINQIAQNFRWPAFGVIIVAHRTDGTYWVVDAQNRVAAARLVPKITLLPCMVYESNGPEDEARWFLNINDDRTTVDSIDKYKAALEAKNSEALALQRILDENGLTVKVGKSPDSIECIGTLMRCVKADRVRLARLMPLLVKIAHTENIQNILVRGMFALAGRPNGDLLYRRDVLEKLYLVGQEGLLNEARDVCKTLRKNGSDPIWAFAFQRAINSGRRKKLDIISLED